MIMNCTRTSTVFIAMKACTKMKQALTINI